MNAPTWGPDEVHVYENGECRVASKPPMPMDSETRWVPIPYEPDPGGEAARARREVTPQSWHRVNECPFEEAP